MSKLHVAAFVLFAFLSGHAVSAPSDALEEAKKSGREAGGAGLRDMNVFSSSDSGEPGSFSDIADGAKSSMGLDALSTDGKVGGASTLDMGSSFEGTMRCRKGSAFVRMGITLKITDCANPSEPVAQLCDKTMRGASCQDNYSDEEVVGSGLVTFTGSPLEGEYEVGLDCGDGSCDVTLKAAFSDKLGAEDMRTTAESDFSGEDDHPLSSIENMRFGSDYGDVEAENAALGECFDEKMTALNDTGRMPASCEPGDTRDLSFPVDSFTDTCETSFTSSTCVEEFPSELVSCEPNTRECKVEKGNATTTCNEVLTASPNANVSGNVEFEGKSSIDGMTKHVAIDFINDRWSRPFNNDLGIATWSENGEIGPFGTTTTWDKLPEEAVAGICDQYPNAEITLEETEDFFDWEEIGFDDATLNAGCSPVWNGVEQESWRGVFYLKEEAKTVSTTYQLEGAGFEDEWTESCTGPKGGSVAEPPSDEAGCVTRPRVCVDDEPREIDGVMVERECWNWQTEHACQRDPVHKTCDVEKMEDEGWIALTTKDEVADPADPGGGPESWTEVWEGPETCSGTTEFGCSGIVSEEELAGGESRTWRYCYKEKPGHCNPDDDCSVVERTCLEEEGGLCLKEEQVSSCSSESGCVPGAADVPTEVEDATSNFEKVVAAGALMEQIEDFGGFDSAGNFTVFTGESRRCKEITGRMKNVMEGHSAALAAISTYFGGWAFSSGGASGMALMRAASSMNCCKADPGDVEVGASLGYCTQEHVQLSAARLGGRAVKTSPSNVKTNNTICVNYTNFLPNPTGPAKGRYAHTKQICNHWTRPSTKLSFQLQFDVYEKWCEFDSMLGKLIQEQGREQLKELAAESVGGAITKSVSFPFFDAGGWDRKVEVNGNRVAFWQWNRECLSAEDEEGTFAAEQQVGDLECPAATDVFVAVCSEETCEDLPEHPAWDFSPTWEVFQLKGEAHKLTALNRYTVIEGGCYEDGGCDYDVHAWEAGKGGQLRIPIYMSWPLRHSNEGWGDFTWTHNNVHLRAYTYPMVGPETPKPKLQKCIGPMGGCTESDWVDVPVSNPINDMNHTINSSPKVTLLGDCNETMCDYTAYLEVSLNAKPWSTYNVKRWKPCMLKVLGSCVSHASTKYDRDYQAHCGGFTLDEFLALDISAMDLSDYVETLSDKAEEEFHELWK